MNTELNNIPFLIQNGNITLNEAVRTIACFVQKNFKIFGLQNYSEDFRSEIILHILEKGEEIINKYNYSRGEFFPFIYGNIISLINTKKRILAKKTVNDLVIFDHESSYLSFSEEDSYQNVDLDKIEDFNIKKLDNFSFEDFCKKIKQIKSKNISKRILVLILRSAFYLSDEQIKKISRYLKIEWEDFQDCIQFLRTDLIKKLDRRKLFEERRNKAFFLRQRYIKQIEILEEKSKSNNVLEIRKTLEEKLRIQQSFWTKYTYLANNKKCFLRPSTKFISDILGISERQTRYYISSTKPEKLLTDENDCKKTEKGDEKKMEINKLK